MDDISYTLLTGTSDNRDRMNDKFKHLEQGNWRSCPMSVFVPGSRCMSDCVKVGWPLWLVDSIIRLFDENRLDDARKLSINLAKFIDLPVDYEKAFRIFLEDQANKFTTIKDNNRLRIGLCKEAAFNKMPLPDHFLVKKAAKDQFKDLIKAIRLSSRRDHRAAA